MKPVKQRKCADNHMGSAINTRCTGVATILTSGNGHLYAYCSNCWERALGILVGLRDAFPLMETPVPVTEEEAEVIEIMEM